MSRIITTFFYIGLLRPAPGTWGSAAALALGLWIEARLGFTVFLTVFFAVTAIGFISCKNALKDRTTEDPAEIVIDEVAGQWLALLFPAAAFFFGPEKEGLLPWPAWCGAFVMFRIFDITKPWLVGRADRRHDFIGVMLDDLLAGLFAGVCVIIGGILWHVVLLS